MFILTFQYKLKPALLCVFLLLMFLCPTFILAEEKFTLVYKNADIHELISQVAEITHKEFIVDPKVKGRVTIIANQAMNRADIYSLFVSTLALHGYVAIPSGEIIKITTFTTSK